MEVPHGTPGWNFMGSKGTMGISMVVSIGRHGTFPWQFLSGAAVEVPWRKQVCFPRKIARSCCVVFVQCLLLKIGYKNCKYYHFLGCQLLQIDRCRDQQTVPKSRVILRSEKEGTQIYMRILQCREK